MKGHPSLEEDVAIARVLAIPRRHQHVFCRNSKLWSQQGTGIGTGYAGPYNVYVAVSASYISSSAHYQYVIRATFVNELGFGRYRYFLRYLGYLRPSRPSCSPFETVGSVRNDGRVLFSRFVSPPVIPLRARQKNPYTCNVLSCISPHHVFI